MVTNTQIKDIKELHLETLPLVTKKAFLRCIDAPFFSSGNWYLAGGTALALSAGHRKSVDLDFFTTDKSFDEKKIEQALNEQGDWKTTSMDYATVYGEFFGAKMSLIALPSFKPSQYIKIGNVKMVIPEDIAVMKVIAISQRGKKRDFIDLYWLCHNKENLSQILERVFSQYAVEQNPSHLLKSLVYFKDAEDDPMSSVFFNITWSEVKKFFQKEVPKIAKKLM